jgi:hypothetical protein
MIYGRGGVEQQRNEGTKGDGPIKKAKFKMKNWGGD